MVNGQVERGQNVLVTGIGGGVALLAMQICMAKGANVFVTSGSQEKIDKAVSLGARGGVNYKESECSRRHMRLSGIDEMHDAVWCRELGSEFGQAAETRPQTQGRS